MRFNVNRAFLKSALKQVVEKLISGLLHFFILKVTSQASFLSPLTQGKMCLFTSSDFLFSVKLKH